MASAPGRLGQDIEKMMDLLFDAKALSLRLRLLAFFASACWPQGVKLGFWHTTVQQS